MFHLQFFEEVAIYWIEVETRRIICVAETKNAFGFKRKKYVVILNLRSQSASNDGR